MAFATNLLSRNLRLISRFPTKQRMLSSDSDGQPPKPPGTTHQPLLIKESGLEIDDSVKIAMEVFRKKFTDGLIDRIVVKDGSKDWSRYMLYSPKIYNINMSGLFNEFNLIVKCLPDSSDLGDKMKLNIEKIFYHTMYPLILEHQRVKRIENWFNNVVKFYPIYSKIDNPIIFLEDIRAKRYVVAYNNRRKFHGDQHVRYVMKMLAQYHGSLFTMKDQHPELYKKFHLESMSKIRKWKPLINKGISLIILLRYLIHYVEEQLIALGKTEIIPQLKNLAFELVHLVIMNPPPLREKDKYNIVCHGDMRGTNLMFLYDGFPNGKIQDAKIINWHQPTVNSPVLDVSHYLYCSANKDILNKIDNYLDLYYNLLSEHISNMGGYPSKLYPRETFDQHWRKFSKYGLYGSFFNTRTDLMELDEITSQVGKDFSRPIRNQTAYNQRMIDILEHFVERKQL